MTLTYDPDVQTWPTYSSTRPTCPKSGLFVCPFGRESETQRHTLTHKKISMWGVINNAADINKVLITLIFQIEISEIKWRNERNWWLLRRTRYVSHSFSIQLSHIDVQNQYCSDVDYEWPYKQIVTSSSKFKSFLFANHWPGENIPANLMVDCLNLQMRLLPKCSEISQTWLTILQRN